MQQALEFYKKQRRKILAFNYVGFVIGWDMETDAAEQSIMADSEQVAVISEMSYQLMTDPEFEQAVSTLYAQRDKLDETLRHEIEVAYKSVTDTKKIPQDEYDQQGVSRVRQGEERKQLRAVPSVSRKNRRLLPQADQVAGNARTARLRRTARPIRAALQPSQIRQVF